MITEDYVSPEVAKLLKEKGFNEKCRAFYNDKTLKIAYIDSPISNEKPFNLCLLAPTLQMAMKWLRKNYKIHIDIDYIDFLELGEVWSAKIVDMVTFKEMKIESTCNHYEQMANEAIEFYLKNLNK